MQKNNSFIWFLIFAVFCAADALCIFGLASMPLLLVMYALCCVCSGRNGFLTSGILAVFATVSIFLNKGVFGLFVFMLVTALCLTFSHSRSFGYPKTAFVITLAVCLGIVSATALAVYQSMGVSLTPQVVIQWVSDGFERVGRLYTAMLSETYGASLEEVAGIAPEELISAVKTASLNMMTGTVLLIASVIALAGTALSYKAKYGRVSLLDSYVLSPVGSVLVLVALAVFSAGSKKTMIIAGNIYMTLLPWFALSGIKALKGIFVKKQHVSVFTVVAVAIIAFSVGLSAALVFLGATDVIRGFVAYEK
ncbi:MAG: hypothetical protein II982_04965 [Clostridia bacterium]|nr:hypothetical protein [Clostridia bacterium]